MAVVHAVITKEFTFRGKPERFSNGYNLQTTSTVDGAYLKTLCDALVAMEQVFTLTQIKFPYRVAGLQGEDALYSEEVASPPVGARSVSYPVHPEVCALAQSYIGPKRYLMKYYHCAVQNTATGPHDEVSASDVPAMETSLLKLTNGTLPGSATYCRPNGALATNPFKVDAYLRVHQLKRRGKRP